jgi:hypothetical protein
VDVSRGGRRSGSARICFSCFHHRRRARISMTSANRTGRNGRLSATVIGLNDARRCRGCWAVARSRCRGRTWSLTLSLDGAMAARHGAGTESPAASAFRERWWKPPMATVFTSYLSSEITSSGGSRARPTKCLLGSRSTRRDRALGSMSQETAISLPRSRATRTWSAGRSTQVCVCHRRRDRSPGRFRSIREAAPRHQEPLPNRLLLATRSAR